MLGRFRRRFASEPETLAHHLERAGRTAAAIDYFLRAADAAGARAANREAEGYAQRALALTDLLDGGAERDRREVAALLALGRIRTAIFGYGRNEAAEPLRRALDRCQAAGMHRTEFPLVVALTAQAGVSGDGAKALQMSRRAADLAADSDDPAHKVMAAYAVGVTHCWRGERRNASDAFAAGAALWREALHERLLELGPQDSGIVCMTRGAMNRFHVYVDPAESERTDEAIELARRLGHAHSLNYGLHFKAVQAIEAANWERAETTIREMLDLAEEQGFGTWRSQGRLQVARFAAARLSPRSALEEAEHAVKALPEGGNHASLPQAKGLVGDALRRLGRTAEALTLLQQAVAEAEAGAMGWGLIETLCALARCLLATDGGDATRAEATLARAVALARRQGSRLWELRTACELAEVLLHQGDRSAARDALATTVAAVDGAALPADLARARDLLRAVA
jgi:tetratricopeptide (TPR) repeat protein